MTHTTRKVLGWRCSFLFSSADIFSCSRTKELRALSSFFGGSRCGVLRRLSFCPWGGSTMGQEWLWEYHYLFLAFYPWYIGIDQKNKPILNHQFDARVRPGHPTCRDCRVPIADAYLVELTFDFRPEPDQGDVIKYIFTNPLSSNFFAHLSYGQPFFG